jgi:hypothetical protein
MKKSTLKLFGILTLATGLIASCSSDENPTPSTPPSSSSSFTADANNFKELLMMVKLLWTQQKRYKLTGKIQVNNGATLTIPAGTRIESSGGTASYIAVAQGGKLNVNGTAEKPVIMTSGLPNKFAG